MNFKIVRSDNKYTILDNPYEVYEFIVERIFNEDVRNCSYQTHKEAEEAQCWCEMADIEDEYDGGDFTIECIEY